MKNLLLKTFCFTLSLSQWLYPLSSVNIHAGSTLAVSEQEKARELLNEHFGVGTYYARSYLNSIAGPSEAYMLKWESQEEISSRFQVAIERLENNSGSLTRELNHFGVDLISTLASEIGDGVKTLAGALPNSLSKRAIALNLVIGSTGGALNKYLSKKGHAYITEEYQRDLFLRSADYFREAFQANESFSRQEAVEIIKISGYYNAFTTELPNDKFRKLDEGTREAFLKEMIDQAYIMLAGNLVVDDLQSDKIIGNLEKIQKVEEKVSDLQKQITESTPLVISQKLEGLYSQGQEIKKSILGLSKQMQILEGLSQRNRTLSAENLKLNQSSLHVGLNNLKNTNFLVSREFGRMTPEEKLALLNDEDQKIVYGLSGSENAQEKADLQSEYKFLLTPEEVDKIETQASIHNVGYHVQSLSSITSSIGDMMEISGSHPKDIAAVKAAAGILSGIGTIVMATQVIPAIGQIAGIAVGVVAIVGSLFGFGRKKPNPLAKFLAENFHKLIENQQTILKAVKDTNRNIIRSNKQIIELLHKEFSAVKGGIYTNRILLSEVIDLITVRACQTLKYKMQNIASNSPFYNPNLIDDESLAEISSDWFACYDGLNKIISHDGINPYFVYATPLGEEGKADLSRFKSRVFDRSVELIPSAVDHYKEKLEIPITQSQLKSALHVPIDDHNLLKLKASVAARNEPKLELNSTALERLLNPIAIENVVSYLKLLLPYAERVKDSNRGIFSASDVLRKFRQAIDKLSYAAFDPKSPVVFLGIKSKIIYSMLNRMDLLLKASQSQQSLIQGDLMLPYYSSVIQDSKNPKYQDLLFLLQAQPFLAMNTVNMVLGGATTRVNNFVYLAAHRSQYRHQLKKLVPSEWNVFCSSEVETINKSRDLKNSINNKALELYLDNKDQKQNSAFLALEKQYAALKAKSSQEYFKCNVDAGIKWFVQIPNSYYFIPLPNPQDFKRNRLFHGDSLQNLSSAQQNLEEAFLSFHYGKELHKGNLQLLEEFFSIEGTL